MNAHLGNASNMSGCASVSGNSEDFEMNLHIISVFVIMVVSWLGAGLPIVLSEYPDLWGARKAMNFGRFFGSGVILATV